MNEYRRVLLNKKLWLCLCLLFVLTLGLCWEHEASDKGGDTAAYTQVYKERLAVYSHMSYEDAMAESAEMAEIYTLVRGILYYRDVKVNEERFNQRLEDYVNFYPDWIDVIHEAMDRYTYEEVQMLATAETTLQAQLTHLAEYPEFLQMIKDQAKLMNTVSIFADPNSGSKKNIEKTVKDYAQMDGQELTLGTDLVWNAFYTSGIEDYAGLIVMILVCLMFTEEKRRGLQNVLYACPGGRMGMGLKRLVILMITAVVSVVAIYGGKFALCCWMYGEVPDMARLTQSVPLFKALCHPLPLGTVLILFFVSKVLGVLFAGAVFWVMLSFASTLSVGLVFVSLLAAVEYSLFTLVPDNSILVPFKYINLFSCINQQLFFTHYINIGLIGLMVEAGVLMLIIMPVLSLVLLGSGVWIQAKRHPVGTPSRVQKLLSKVQQNVNKVFCWMRPVANEFYKIMVTQKGAIILLILVVLRWNGVDIPYSGMSELEMMKERYYAQYAGVITEDTITSLGAEEVAAQQKLDELLAAMSESSSEVSMNASYALQNQQDRIMALQEVIRECEEKLARQEAEGIAAYLVPHAGYTILLKPQTADRLQNSEALLALLFLVLMVAGCGAYENQQGSQRLLRATSGGQNKLIRHKIVSVTVLSLLVWALIYGVQLGYYWVEIETWYCLEAPIQNLAFLSDVALPVSIGTLIVLVYIIRLAILVAVGWIMLRISLMCSRMEQAMLAGVIALVLPGALQITAIPEAAYVSMIPGMTWMGLLIEHGLMAGLVLLLIIGIGTAAMVTCAKCWKGRV